MQRKTWPRLVAEVTCTAIPSAAGLVNTRRCSSVSSISTGAAELPMGSGLMTSTVLTCVAGNCAPRHGCLSGLSGTSRRLVPGVFRGVLRAKPTVLPELAIVEGYLTPRHCQTSGPAYFFIVLPHHFMHLGCRKAHGQRNLQSCLTLATHHILRPCIIMNMQAQLSRASKSSTMQLSNRPPTRSSSAQNHMQSRQISSVHSRQAGQQHFRSQIAFGRRLGSFRQRTGPATSALFGHTVAENSFVVNGDIEKVKHGVAAVVPALASLSLYWVLKLHSATILQVFEYAADFSHINRWDPGEFQ